MYNIMYNIMYIQSANFKYILKRVLVIQFTHSSFYRLINKIRKHSLVK